ncbi:YiiX family permuted papain-like enzyme [Leptospira sarikeiensis]|uniref:YiiX family permuted papain-like enzyme n=1 Tax=Leptospira sarikeiensis TaxID=2484943 RepID=A0A4R9K5V0_9LEPT|nr:YiiX family permuted papain-like enzyme [Leptospira sarikeiensis]TGL60677.1 YiiX family permuted papain-like enzyme [Leptospira sarikeiensis]
MFLKIKYYLILILLILAFPLIPKEINLNPSLLKEGDIIFQETNSEQAKAIKLVTKSRYTHTGIILDRGNGLEVLEAVQPVRWISLKKFVDKGISKHYVIKRVKDKNLSKDILDKMKTKGASFLGKNYDLYFEWSDDRIYCTELIWKLYKDSANIEVGELKKLGDYDLSHPMVKKIMKKRYGKNIPLEEDVISPQSMFESPTLITVSEN